MYITLIDCIEVVKFKEYLLFIGNYNNIQYSLLYMHMIRQRISKYSGNKTSTESAVTW